MGDPRYRERRPVNIFQAVDDLELAFKRDPLGAAKVVSRNYSWYAPIYKALATQLGFDPIEQKYSHYG